MNRSGVGGAKAVSREAVVEMPVVVSNMAGRLWGRGRFLQGERGFNGRVACADSVIGPNLLMASAHFLFNIKNVMV